MATTTFNGSVRSEKGFQQVNKNSSTGAYTARTLGLKPDLTSLKKINDAQAEVSIAT